MKQGIFPPPIEIFGPEESHVDEMDEEKAAPLGEKIVKTLEQFSIESHLAEILIGPTVIQFRIQLAPGIKVSKVAALANDIALAMAVPSLRIEAPIPGKPYVGIEIPNPRRRGIPLRTVIEDDCFKKTKLSLPLPFGVAVNGDSVIVRPRRAAASSRCGNHRLRQERLRKLLHSGALLKAQSGRAAHDTCRPKAR